MDSEKGEKVHTNDVIVAENYLFTKFLLSEKLLKALNDMNYLKPSPIQLKIIPLARSKLDMIIQSKSGTGKTLSFSICLLETYDEELKFPQAIIIVPTREIAVQVTNTLNGLGKYMRHFKACEFIGGTELKNDRKRIQTTKIVVGTPGRILHLIKNEIFNTTNVKAIVFDEADKLFEQGHLGKEVQSIFRAVEHKNLQIIASTATVTEKFEAQIKRHMKNPIGITPKQEAPILLGIKQFALELPQEDDNIQLMRNKVAELEKIFTKIPFKQCLLFTDSQNKTDSYGSYLKKLGWKNEIINGSQEQSQRLKVLNKLAKFKCRILITTDLMARGIDIENVNLVINLDLPYDCFTYLHRIGRAGRFGTYGIAITLLNGDKDAQKFRKMLNEIGTNDSMVYKFPSDVGANNFWDFDNRELYEKLLKFVSIIGDQNGNMINGTKDDVAVSDIVDENLMLLEITRKLIDQKSEEESVNFDTDALLKEYESACINGVNENECDTRKISNGSDMSKMNGNAVEKINGSNSIENGQVDLLLEEYEKACQSYSNENDSQVNGCDQFEPSSPKEKRSIIFVRDQKELEEPLTLKSDSSEPTESDYDSDETEYSTSDNEDYAENEQPKNRYEFAQLNGTNHEYQLYDQYVMDGYLQWRRTFFFQLANIQNYANSNREEYL